MKQAEWMDQFRVSSMEPVNKGWSQDEKFRIRTWDGRDCLLRLSNVEQYETKKKEYEIIQRYSALGFPMSQPVDFGRWEETGQVYMLLSWLEGKDLESVLPDLPEAEQYRLGREAGRILKQIHSIPLSPADRPAGTKRERKLRQLSQYEQSQLRIRGDESAIRYVKDNIGLIWQQPPVYLHGDFHPGNLIYRPDGSIGVIDFNRWEIGDPYEEFYKLQSFGREISVPYCAGQLDAYFDDAVPEDFWRAMAVYVAHASLFSIKWAEKFGDKEIAGMTRRCRQAMEDYADFHTVIPRWYHHAGKAVMPACGNQENRFMGHNEIELRKELLGKCGFYCGACPTYLDGTCRGCQAGQREGDCFTRDCANRNGLAFCGACREFPCETILTKERCTVPDKGWLRWKQQSRNELRLYIPNPEDGWFYSKMLSDPATMAYNAPWFPPDGCIPNPEAEWEDLCKDWIGKEPQRFYAYLQRKSDGAFVGDVNFHYSQEKDWWDMGIVIYAPERGNGYGKQGLRLLVDRAFRVAGISRLHNEFESTRDAAYHIHKAVGFREIGEENGIIHLLMTKEDCKI